jgi:transposase
MTQNGTLVGLDIAKGKVDAAIRSAGAEASFANNPPGRRQLLDWLNQHGVCKAVMEASGGYERSWAALLRKAGLEVLIVDPSGSATLPGRPGSWPRTTRSMPA